MIMNLSHCITHKGYIIDLPSPFPYSVCAFIIAPPRYVSWILLGLQPWFLLGHITCPHQVRVHSSPSPHIDSSACPSDSSSGSEPCSLHIVTMSWPIAGAWIQTHVGSSSILMVKWGGIVSWTLLIAPMLPFMVGLSLLYLNELVNDPIHHDVGWSSMLTKLPSHIPKVEGIDGEDPTNHVWSFHMWCFSNSITNDSIRLWLFQCMLTGDATKLYVDEHSTSHSIFMMLYKSFLSYFWLPLQYNIDTELLTTFHQSSATHLSHYTQEWHWRRSTCHAQPFEERVHLYWFLKGILSPIWKLVMSHFPQTEEEVLETALRYNLTYAQYDYVYTIVRDLPCPRGANLMGDSEAVDNSIGSLHTLHHILGIVMAIHRRALVPPTFILLILLKFF